MKPLIPDRKIEMQNLLIAKIQNKTLFFGKKRKKLGRMVLFIHVKKFIFSGKVLVLYEHI